MSNVLKFPNNTGPEPDELLQNAMGNLTDCIVIGVTKEGELFTGVSCESTDRSIYLLRLFEHLLLAEALSQC